MDGGIWTDMVAEYRLVLMGLGAAAILCAVLAALLIRQRDILSPTDEEKA